MSKVSNLLKVLKATSWEYVDARGTMKDSSDKGGTDITYFMIRDTGELDIVSGSRIKKMKGI